MDVRSIQVAKRPLAARFRAPPSKSVTHRALVAAALAEGDSTIENPLQAEDTWRTVEGLRALGIEVRTLPDRWVVRGDGGRVPGGGSLWLGESGTSLRFLTAVASLGATPSQLGGSRRLCDRPLRELTAALEQMGAVVVAGAEGGFPLRIGGTPPRGGAVEIQSDRSSQFASALLLIGSRMARGLDLQLLPRAVSVPYVRLTASVLSAFGVVLEERDDLSWRVAAGISSGRHYEIEGDHSTTSYHLAAAVLAGGVVRVDGLRPDSLQPDARLGRILRGLGAGVETGPNWIEVRSSGDIPAFDLALDDAPDLVPPLAALALFAEGPCTIRGIGHLRHKESNRLELLAENLRRLGRAATAFADRLDVGPRTPLRGSLLRTASDHRMAMAFAIVGLRLAGVAVEAPASVAKSHPGFWEDFRRLEG